MVPLILCFNPMCDLSNCNYDDFEFIDKNIYDTVFNWDGNKINSLISGSAMIFKLYGYRAMEFSMYHEVYQYVVSVIEVKCKLVEDERPVKERRCAYMRVTLAWLKHQANEFELGNFPVL